MSDDLARGVHERATGFLTELCAVSSASGDGPGLHRMARRLAAALEEHGQRSEIHDEDDRNGRPAPVLVARGPAAGEGCLLVVGHLDTVLPAVEPRREPGRLLGTGALDMKGGFAALVGALDLLACTGRRPPEDLLLVAVPDEEVGGPISERAMRYWGRYARGVLVLEPGEARGKAETVVLGRRGMAEWRLDAAGRAAHSGLAYWEGRSALAATARWVWLAQQQSQPGEGPTVNVARLVAGDEDFVGELGEHHSLLGSHRLLNVVPARAMAEGEVRYLSAADRESVLHRLHELAAEVSAATGVQLRLAVSGAVPPVNPAGPGRALAGRARALAASRGWDLQLESDRGGVSFLNFLPDPEALPVLDGLGPVGGGMHTRDEHVDLRSLERRIELLADLLISPGI